MAILPLDLSLGCGNSTIKYLLFFFNFIFAFCGVLVVSLGSYLLAYGAAHVNGINYSLALFVAVGIIIFLVSVFGCCGALRESGCLLTAFAVSLIVIIFGLLTISGLVIGFSDFVEAKIQDVFLKASQGDKDFYATVDFIQEQSECCGYYGPALWKDNLPTSCCPGALKTSCPLEDAFQVGCKEKFVGLVRNNGIIFGSIGLVIGLIMIVGIWFSLTLGSRIRELDRRMKHL